MIDRQTPFFPLLVAAILSAMAALSIVWIAQSQPWLGFTLQVDLQTQDIMISNTVSKGPAADIPLGSTIISIAGQDLAATDLVEEPDQLPSYDVFKDVMDRQDYLYGALRAGEVDIVVQTGLETLYTLAPKAKRPIADLPFVFWLQILTGIVSVLIGVWVWTLRRRERSAQLLAIAGVCIAIMTFPAAIYSTREIVLDGTLFRWLAAIDHFGALFFGVAMLMVFFVYPRQVVPQVALWTLPIVIGVWWLLDTMHSVFHGPPTGFHLPALLMMMLFFPIAFLQYRETKDNPAARAAMLSFVLATIVGTGAFIALIVVPHVFGMRPMISQGYAFVLFLLMFLGVAVGVARYRLFELEGWAFSILFYFGGVILLLLLDAALITMVAVERVPAFGISLLIVGITYLPLRDYLARRLLHAKTIDREELFRRIVDAALMRGRDEQFKAWKNVIADVFQPLDITSYEGTSVDQPTVSDEGLTLTLPTVQNLSSLSLRFAFSGRKLFTPRDSQVAAEMCTMLSHALASSRARDVGAETERTRIARDMHDNIGAQLLSALHSDTAERKDTLIRESISDLRSIINNEAERDKGLAEALAELRLETLERLAASNIKLDWSCTDTIRDEHVVPRIVYGLRSIVREAASNTIRHSNAKRFYVHIEAQDDSIRLNLSDDGDGLGSLAQLSSGNGLRNIEARLTTFNGTLDVIHEGPGLSLLAEIPLKAEARN